MYNVTFLIFKEGVVSDKIMFFHICEIESLQKFCTGKTSDLVVLN